MTYQVTLIKSAVSKNKPDEIVLHFIWNLLVICPVLPVELKEQDVLVALKRAEC